MTMQVQETFSVSENYASIGIETFLRGSNSLKRNSSIKLTLGGGPMGSKTYSFPDGFYDLPYPVYETWYNYDHLGQIHSTYTGFVAKLSHLNTFYYKRKASHYIRISGGLDVGYYALQDHYEVKVQNDSSKQERTVSGTYISSALSLGGVVDFKKSIYKNWYLNAFAQFMFYFNKNPNVANIYDQSSPFAYWKLEVGVGLGYTLY